VDLEMNCLETAYKIVIRVAILKHRFFTDAFTDYVVKREGR